MGKVGSKVASFSRYSSGGISSLGSAGGVSVGILTYQSLSTLVHLTVSPTSGSLGVKCLQTPSDMSSELCVSSSCISFPSSVKFLIEHSTGQLRF